MAVTRPWVFPDDVRDYSSYQDVQERDDDKLDVDIVRAEQMVIAYTHNDFSGENYEEIPKSVRTAVILLAERFAHSAYMVTRQFTSETFDDYSYTANDSEVSLSEMGLGSLLDPYVISQASGTVFMRLRKL